VTQCRDTDDELPRLYCADEVAEAIRCSEWWVKEQARRRRIPFVRVAGAYRFTAAHVTDIVRLLEEQPDEGSSAPAPHALPRRRRAQAVDTTAAVPLVARPPRRKPRAVRTDAA
jgi:hypothetical protein